MIVSLRDHAGADGTLPREFDELVRDRSASCSPKRRPDGSGGYTVSRLSPSALAPRGGDTPRRRGRAQPGRPHRRLGHGEESSGGSPATRRGWYEAVAGRERRRFYGRPTSCGHVVERSTMGFAHPVLPAPRSTSATAARRVLTQVVARGATPGGVQFGLTDALAEELGIGTGRRSAGDSHAAVLTN